VKLRQINEQVARWSFGTAASVSVIVVTLIFFFLFREGMPFAKDPGLDRLFESRWVPKSFQHESYGLLPLVTGSALVTALATLIAIPFGVSGAAYIAEIAGPREREILKPLVEMIAAIPSVVLGFFGLAVLAPVVKNAFNLPTGLTALTGGILLAFMAIPTIITISEDALRSVPKTYKEASMALGANRAQTMWKVTIPAALSGITASVMLGMGRVIGETMSVIMVTGNAPQVTLSPFEPVRTMTATIAAEMGEAIQVAGVSTHYQSLFWIGIVLLFSTFVLNIIAMRVLKGYRRV
jgi:phosphate transport system permease protein